jgi:geranylgeranyl pyrophosphate synthase
MLELKIADCLEEVSNIIHNRIDHLLKMNEKIYAPELLEAMRYSSLIKGKNIRPFLTIIISQIFSNNNKYIIDVAAAIEIIHTYSLIHDDLPAMDDDDYRRGQLSCHKKYGEATAILAGDSLLTFAFEILSNLEGPINPHIKLKLINMIAKNIGFQGMAGGQMLDLKIKNKSSKEEIAIIHNLKTGKLFNASIESAIILNNISNIEKKYLMFYAHDLGLLFQIKDDILDHKSGDKENYDAASIVENIGLKNAEKQLYLIYDQAISHLNHFGSKTRLLRDLLDFIINIKN